ncbi:Glycosyl transferase group 1 [uncultured Desulfobacterium sp.]|uniref:Glycosyl transferase group 1 n=1 Tax=uncultured Desulfobacterium sp. TaxID=201089 RepID=A0A445MS04_9BACT|nr:Glycosyl transferase group 1 [uncultured Desulfobacterium sp.]
MKRALKIGLVCKNFFFDYGGAEGYTVSLARELLKHGHEVHAFANTWQEEPGIVFYHVPIVPLSLPLKNLSFALFAKKRLAEVKLDIIHSMDRTLYQDIYRASDGIVPVHLEQGYPNPALRRLKAVGPRRLALLYLEKRIFGDHGTKIIQTNSQLVKGHIINYYHVHPDRIRVIYNGIDTERFFPGVRDIHRESVRKLYRIRENEILILFVSNDHRRKGLQNLLEGINKLQNKNIRLMVIGQGKGALGKWIEKNIPGDRILFVGHKNDMERYYGAADIFVLPTRYDAFANVCLEAMACGLPVITTMNNGASELIRDGENGFVLKEGSPDEIRDRIEALRSKEYRLQMGKKAADKAKGFTVEGNCSKVIGLYDELADRTRR